MGMIGITVLALACVINLAYKADQTNIRIGAIMEEVQRCSRIHLFSSREDVLKNMGQPVKTEVVPSVTGGLADRLFYRYKTVKIDRNPYFDVDQHFDKVMAYSCAFGKSDLRSAIREGKAEMPKDIPLPTDSKRY